MSWDVPGLVLGMEMGVEVGLGIGLGIWVLGQPRTVIGNPR